MPPQNADKRAKLTPEMKTHKIVCLSDGGEVRFVLEIIIPDFQALRHDTFVVLSDDVSASDLDLPQSRGSWYLTVSSTQSTSNNAESGITVGLVRGSCTTGSFNVHVRSGKSKCENKLVEEKQKRDRRVLLEAIRH